MTPMATRPSSRLLARVVDRLFASLLVTLVFALWPHIAYAATIIVDGATCTLPDAITAANTDVATGGCTSGSGDDTLLLTAPIYSLTTGAYHTYHPGPYTGYQYGSDGMSATPSVTTTIVISGGIAGAIVERSGSDPYRLFNVGDTGDLTIQNVIIRYGKATPFTGSYDPIVYGLGGGIFNRGTLTLVNSQLFSNTAPSAGGGIYNGGNGTVNLANVAFIANVAGYEGGGFSNHRTAILTNTVFISNTAQYGGGFSNQYEYLPESYDKTSKAILSNSDFFSNTARFGGGFYGSGTFGGAGVTNELTNVNFIANVAVDGGGLSSGSTSSTILSNTTFIANRAKSGGGISHFAMFFATVIITNSHFISNIADAGGGIYSSDFAFYGIAAHIFIFDSEFRANRATYNGGAIRQDHSLVSIVRSRLVDNWAGQTGSVLLKSADVIDDIPSPTSIEQSCIVNNTYTAVTNEGDEPIDASHNWWGAADGPTSTGHGDSVSSSVTVTPFLTSAVLNCPTRVTRKFYLPHVDQ